MYRPRSHLRYARCCLRSSTPLRSAQDDTCGCFALFQYYRKHYIVFSSQQIRRHNAIYLLKFNNTNTVPQWQSCRTDVCAEVPTEIPPTPCSMPLHYWSTLGMHTQYSKASNVKAVLQKYRHIKMSTPHYFAKTSR